MTEVAQKVNRLLATDVQDDVKVVSHLLDVYEDYQCTKNLIYPQKDILAYLVNCLQKPARIPDLHILAMALLTQFCDPPLGCDAEKIRGWLVNLGLIEVLCDSLGSVNFATALQPSIEEPVRAVRVDLLERSTALLLAMASSMLPAKQPLVMDKLIRVLCQLCMPSARCGRMFDYPVQATLLIQELMCNNKLFASSITFSERTTSTELYGLLFGCRTLCSEHAFVDVVLARSTDSSELRSLASELVDSALLWPRPTKFAKSSKSSSAGSVGQLADLSFGSYKDRHIGALKLLQLGDVVRGCHFFARFIDPDSTANKLSTIESLLCDTKHERLSKLPAIGDMVTCFGPRPKRRVQLIAQPMSSASTSLSERCSATELPESDDGDSSNSIYFRGQILQAVSSSCYELLAIDYGFVVMASSEQLYNECSALLHVRPDAVLCTLRGVGSVPVSDAALCNIIDTLCMIAKGRPVIGRRIVQGLISTHMLKLLECCPLTEINEKAASLLAELSRDGQLRPHLRLAVFGASPTDSSLLCLAKRFFEKGWIKAASAAFSTVANMLICDEAAESADIPATLANLKNTDVQLLLDIITREGVSENARDCSPGDRASLFAAALQCVRNFFSRNISKCSFFEEDIQAMSRPASRSASLQNSCSQGIARATSLLTTSRSSPTLLNNELWEKPTVSVERCSLPNATFGMPSPNCGRRSFTIADRGKSPLPRKCRSKTTSAAQVSQASSSPMQPAFTVSVNEKPVTLGHSELPDHFSSNPCERMPEATTYVLGMNFPYMQDDQHEILNGGLVTSLNGEDITMHITAFSNSESGGSLFIGVSGGKVFGIFLDRGQRDALRLRIDSLIPFDRSRNPNAYRTLFCTVIDPKKDCIIPDTFVIEIAVQPSAFNSPLRQTRTGKVYVRKCNRSVLATASDVRELGIRRGLKHLIFASRFFEKPPSYRDSALMSNEGGRQCVGRRS